MSRSATVANVSPSTTDVRQSLHCCYSTDYTVLPLGAAQLDRNQFYRPWSLLEVTTIDIKRELWDCLYLFAFLLYQSDAVNWRIRQIRNQVFFEFH